MEGKLRTGLCIMLLIALSVGGLIADPLVKIGFIDPYEVMIRWPNAQSYAPLSYYGQIDSLGLDFVTSVADSGSTRNAWNIGIAGQDTQMVYGLYHLGLANTVGASHYVLAEAELDSEASAELGYHWLRGTGLRSSDGLGWQCRAGIDPAGQALALGGAKIVGAYPCRRRDDGSPFCVREWFRNYLSAKITNNNGYDTVCEVVTVYVADSFACDTTGCRWVQVWRTLRETYTTADFPVTDQWVELSRSMYYPAYGRYGPLYITVNWPGHRTVTIDRLTIKSKSAADIEGLSTGVLDGIFTAYYGRINPDNQKWFYPKDEPKAPNFWGYDKFEKAAMRNGPGHRTWASVRDFVPLFNHDVDPQELNYNFYVITSTTDSASSGAMSVQTAYDDLLAFLSPRAYFALDTVQKPWSAFMQVGASWDGSGNAVWRDPTYNELKVLAGLPICYGASGIGYFTYCTQYRNISLQYGDSAAAAQPVSAEYDYEPLAGPPGDTNAAHGAISFRGLVDWSSTTSRWERNANWYRVKALNGYLDSVWTVIETLQWRGAGASSVASSVQGSFVTSVTGSLEPAWIENGFFEDGSGAKYIMLLNRRTLSTESQFATLKVSSYGYSTLTDLVSYTEYSAYDSSGVTKFEIPLPPGEIVVLKWHNQQTFKGSWSGEWPRYSTIRVTGDITIDSAKSLTVLTSPTILANTDSLHAGNDASRTEFIVKGTLRLTGQPGAPITIGPDCSAYDGWRGISTEGSQAKLVLEHFVLKKATIGLSLVAGYDTLIGGRIEDCSMYGILSGGGPFYLEADTFQSAIADSMKYGIRLTGSSGGNPTLQSCVFNGIKYPLYLFGASPRVVACKVTRDAAFQGSQGTPAVWTRSWSNASFADCIFENYSFGLKVGLRDRDTVETCAFRSNKVNGPTNEPYMHMGIVGDSASSSTCRVRFSCFDGISADAVYRRYTVVDLGSSSSDPGYNSFFVDTFSYGGPTKYWYPGHAIHNLSTDTVRAKYCAFDPLYGDPRNSLYGPVDITGASDWVECYTGILAKAIASEPEQDTVLDTALIFGVDQNSPNPFNPATEIRFTVPAPCNVTIEVFNLLGQRVATLIDAFLPAGHHQTRWYGTSDAGQPVASGLYFYRVQAGDMVVTKKMLLLK